MYEYSVPFYGYIISLCRDRHLWLICDSVNSHLGCLSLFDHMNKVVKTYLHVFWGVSMFSSLLNRYLRLELLGHAVGLCLVPHLVEQSNWFPKWMHDFAFSPVEYDTSNFFTSLPLLHLDDIFIYL